MSQEYQKLVEAPLLAPSEANTVNYKQLPENVAWLADGRGIRKRPGSLPFAFSDVGATGATNYIAALAAVNTPTTRLTMNQDLGADTDLQIRATTLLAYRWGNVTYGDWSAGLPSVLGSYGLFEISPYRAYLSATDRRLVRGRDRDDAAYYLLDESDPNPAPGLSWTAQTSGFTGSQTILATMYGNGLYVAGGGIGCILWTSPDAVHWTVRDCGFVDTSGFINDALYAGGLFLVSGSLTGAPFGQISTSTDGVTWLPRTSNISDNVSMLAYGAAMYVAGGGSQLASSPDAITWTARTSQFGATGIADVFYGGGRFMAWGASSKLSTSPDGITWTARTVPFGGNTITRVIYAGGLHIAVGNGGNLATSDDLGVTWTNRACQFSTSNVNDITYGNGLFVIAGADNKISTSVDGINWNARTSNLTGTFANRIAYSTEGEIFIVVGDSGSLCVSYDGTTWIAVTSQFSTSLIRNILVDSGGLILLGGSAGKVSTSVSTTPSSSGVVIDDDTLVGEVVSGTTYNAAAQLTLPAITARPEPRYGNPIKNSGTKLEYIQALARVPGGTNVAPLNAINAGRIDTVSDATGAFFGGSGGPIYYYDGHRAHVAGAFAPLSHTLSAKNYELNVGASAGAGSLSAGAYNYMYTFVSTLPSGELVESVPVVAELPVTSLLNKSVLVHLGGGASYGGALNDYAFLYGAAPRSYRTKGYTTVAATSITFGATNPSSVELFFTTAHDLVVGDYVKFNTFTGSLTTLDFEIIDLIVSAVTETSITATTTPSFNPGFLSATFTGTHHVTAEGYIQLYRTKADGSIFYEAGKLLVPSIDFTAVTQYTDVLADSHLVTAYADTSFTRYPAPAVTESICIHQGRMIALVSANNSWYVTPDRLPSFTLGSSTYEPYNEPTNAQIRFSSATSLQYFPAENAFFVPAGTAGRPQAVVSVNDILYIFMEGAIFYVQGKLDEEVNYSINLLTDQIGCRDPRSVVRIGTSIFFMSQTGLAQLEGATISYELGQPVDPIVKQDDVVTACYFWRSKNLLLVSANHMLQYETDAGSTAFDAAAFTSNAARPYKYLSTIGKPRTLVYDFNAKKWAIWDIECFNGATEWDGDLICAPSIPPGTVSQSAKTHFTRLSSNCNWTDSGKAFTSRYFSEWYDGGAPAVDKTFNRLGLYSTDTVEAGGQGFELTVRTERNWERGSTLQELETDEFLVQRGYARQPYATTPYGDSERPYKVLALSNQKVKSLRVILENAEPNGDFCINAMAVEEAGSFMNMKDL